MKFKMSERMYLRKVLDLVSMIGMVMSYIQNPLVEKERPYAIFIIMMILDEESTIKR